MVCVLGCLAEELFDLQVRLCKKVMAEEKRR